jgi:hypothetical protein
MDGRRLHFERSLALHAEVARRVRADPAVVERARQTLESWIERGGRSVELLLQWREVLAQPVEQVVAVLTERSERAAWLRNASPFAGVLEPHTHLTILRSVKREGTTAALPSPTKPET